MLRRSDRLPSHGRNVRRDEGGAGIGLLGVGAFGLTVLVSISSFMGVSAEEVPNADESEMTITVLDTQSTKIESRAMQTAFVQGKLATTVTLEGLDQSFDLDYLGRGAEITEGIIYLLTSGENIGDIETTDEVIKNPNNPTEGFNVEVITVDMAKLSYIATFDEGFTLVVTNNADGTKFIEGVQATFDGLLGIGCGIGGSALDLLPGVDGLADKCKDRYSFSEDDRVDDAKLRRTTRVKALEAARKCAPENIKNEKAAIIDSFREEAVKAGVPAEIVDQVIKVVFINEDKVDYTKNPIAALQKKGVLKDGMPGAKDTEVTFKDTEDFSTICKITDEKSVYKPKFPDNAVLYPSTSPTPSAEGESNE